MMNNDVTDDHLRALLQQILELAQSPYPWRRSWPPMIGAPPNDGRLVLAIEMIIAEAAIGLRTDKPHTLIRLAGTVKPDAEDSGAALIAEINGPDENFFVRLQSYDETKAHPLMNQLNGKPVRILITADP